MLKQEAEIRWRPRLFLLQVLQLGLVLSVAYLFLIEQTYGFDRLIPIVFAGFILHSWLPAKWRGWFFVLLFPVCSVVLLGFIAGVVLVGLGLALFLICHLPVSLSARVGILIAIAIGLAFIRGGAVETTIPGVQMYFQTQTLPILSALFMFRAAVYLYDLRHEEGSVPWWQRLGYFFLFPNICFPLFPVIDYQTFKRTRFDRNPVEIYQKGIDWILRGVTHLLLYRIVYHYLVPDPFEIHDFVGVGQYVLSSFLLYLRVSGLFHLIVGVLCLFGYDLPETHHRYYLAESFTDFWRRINIYWKDFMVKLFYFPVFMSLRRWGVTRAMIVATLATFFITWLLHSYQWYWIRGTFPFHTQDMIFWGVLAVLVTLNSIYEEKYGRRRPSLAKNAVPTPRQAVVRSIKTASVFITICVLWSFWTSSSINQWLAIMAIMGTASVADIGVVSVVLLAAILTGAIVQLVGRPSPVLAKSEHNSVPRRAALVGSASIVLLAAANPTISNRLHPQATSVISTITGDQLNTRDQKQLVKGYYEELLGSESSGSMVWSVRLEEPETWKWNGRAESDHQIKTNDLRGAELRPNLKTVDKGQTFLTNRWGMRDQEYDMAKYPGTYRIAMLGSSHTVGAGVVMEDTFPSLVEKRLNSGDFESPFREIEILNFAAAGDSILRRMSRFQNRVLDFEIDAVIDMSISGESHLAVRNLRDAVLQRTANLDWELLDIIDRAAVTSQMSSDAIDNRLGPFATEILRYGYRQLASTAEQYQIKVVVLVLPRLEDTDAIYREEWESISRVALEAGLAAVTLEGVYGPLNNRSTLKLASWDWHPNSEGHALLAERVYKELLSLGWLATKSAPDDSRIEGA